MKKKIIAVGAMIACLAFAGCGLLDSGLTTRTGGFIPSTTKGLIGKSSREIFASFGPPAQKFKNAKGEVWIYVKKREKELKLFGIGKKTADCSCVSVTINENEVVGTKGPYPCSCRLLSQPQPSFGSD